MNAIQEGARESTREDAADSKGFRTHSVSTPEGKPPEGFSKSSKKKLMKPPLRFCREAIAKITVAHGRGDPQLAYRKFYRSPREAVTDFPRTIAGDYFNEDFTTSS